MLKEIVQQQHTILNATSYSQKELKPLIDRIKTSKNIYTIGAGTAAASYRRREEPADPCFAGRNQPRT